MVRSHKSILRIGEYNDSHEEIWENYVLSYPEASLGHLIGWRNVIEKSYGHKPCYLVAEQGGKLVGVLPLFIVKTPFAGRCAISIPYMDCAGICASQAHVRQRLFEAAVALTQRFHCKYIELRHSSRHFAFLPAKQTKAVMILKLHRDPELLWSSFDPKLRNQIRKAQKSGLSVTFGGLELLGDFYEVFLRNMRDIGVPAFPCDFFKNVFLEFPDRSRIAVVLYADKVIGGAVMMWFKQTVIVPWASSNRAYFKYCPNNILYWEIIKHCCLRGFEYFDFGRSTVGSGTFHFKRRWGPEVRQLNWEYYLNKGSNIPDYTSANRNYALAMKIWKHLPLGLVRNLSTTVVRYLPGA